MSQIGLILVSLGLSMVTTRSLVIVLWVVTSAVIAPTPPAAFSAPKTAPEQRQLSITRMGLGQIKLGDTDARVKQLLGQPQTTKTESTTCCGPLQS